MKTSAADYRVGCGGQFEDKVKDQTLVSEKVVHYDVNTFLAFSKSSRK